MGKAERLRALAQQRRCDARKSYKGDYRDIKELFPDIDDWDDFVSPWTKSAGNFESSLVLVGQDWGCEKRLLGANLAELRHYGMDRTLETNSNVAALLDSCFNKSFKDVFATNLFPFIKLGGMSAPVSNHDMRLAWRAYCLPQLQIVRPKTVLLFGANVLNAVRQSIGMKRTTLRVSDRQFDFADMHFIGLPHPGRLGTANAGGLDHVYRFWHQAAADHLSDLENQIPGKER